MPVPTAGQLPFSRSSEVVFLRFRARVELPAEPAEALVVVAGAVRTTVTSRLQISRATVDQAVLPVPHPVETQLRASQVQAVE
jgi:hypothetical protein